MKIVGKLFIAILFIGFVLFSIGMFNGLGEIDRNSSINTSSVLNNQIGAFACALFIFMFIFVFNMVIKLREDRIVDASGVKEEEEEEKANTTENNEELISNANEQLSVFMAQLKHKTDVDLNKDLLKLIAEPFDACHGVIYEAHDENKLVASCTFATAVDKEITKIVSTSEGLIGQAIKNKKTTLIDEIPEGYINIISGLGQSSPTTLIIMPLFRGEELLGVIEIASYKGVDVGLKTLANLIPEIISDKL